MPIKYESHSGWSEVYDTLYITLIKGKQVGRNRERGMYVCQTVMRPRI